MNNIIYSVEDNLDPIEFRDVLILSTLGERRPIEDFERIGKMVRNANLIITARSNKRLVGIARSVSDFAYCTYLSDLAVVKEFQHTGIRRELIRQTKLAAPAATLVLLSAPLAVDFYPKIGMTKHEAAFILKEISNLR